ncbi:MAG: alpha/beta fold hydrolase [Mycobacteriales bacterium]
MRAVDLTVSAGRLHGHHYGPPEGPRDAPLVVCLPGLSANAITFAPLAEALAAAGREVLALDLRGRGQSPAGPPGSHGWSAHAQDALEAAAALGHDSVDLVGHSMGAYVAMAAVAANPARVRRLVLIDAVGRPDPGCLPPILASVERLGAVAPSREAYLERVRGLGTVRPWSPVWDAYFDYELTAVDGGVMSRTDRAAVLEDATYGAGHDPTGLWGGLTGPVLVLRAEEELLPGSGHVLTAADAAGFPAAVPSAVVAGVQANHYGIVVHPAAVKLATDFLR